MRDLTNRSLYAGPVVALLAALLAFALGAMPVAVATALAGFAWPVLWFAVQFAARPRPADQVVDREEVAL